MEELTQLETTRDRPRGLSPVCPNPAGGLHSPTMSPPSIRRASLGGLDQATLEDLVRHGEDLLVERKQDIPKDSRFGAAVGSLANTLGGWILLGVADDGSVTGFSIDRRLDLQSHLGALLQAQVDPLPPFVAEMREVDGQSIAVIRVFPSADSPHIVRGTGAVYVRSSKGKEPVDDHRTLLELARRGDMAEEAAHRRLRSLRGVGMALHTPDFNPGDVAWSEEPAMRYVVRAAPLTVTPAFSDWPLTRRAAEALSAVADEHLLPPRRPPYGRQTPYPTPIGRGIVVRGSQEVHANCADEATLVADSGGVIGLSIRRGSLSGQPTLLLNAALEEELMPLATALSSLLNQAEAYGRAVVDLWLLTARGVQVPGAASEGDHQVHVSRELTVPADDDEVRALAESWHRELQRNFGIVKFENEPQAAP